MMEETFNLALPLALVGMAVPLRSRVANSAKWPLAMALLFYVWFFNWRANLPLDNPLLAGVHERFWMQPNLVRELCRCFRPGSDCPTWAALATEGRCKRVASAPSKFPVLRMALAHCGFFAGRRHLCLSWPDGAAALDPERSAWSTWLGVCRGFGGGTAGAKLSHARREQQHCGAGRGQRVAKRLAAELDPFGPGGLAGQRCPLRAVVRWRPSRRSDH